MPGMYRKLPPGWCRERRPEMLGVRENWTTQSPLPDAGTYPPSPQPDPFPLSTHLTANLKGMTNEVPLSAGPE